MMQFDRFARSSEREVRSLPFIERRPYTPFNIPVVQARLRSVDTSRDVWRIGETASEVLNFERLTTKVNPPKNLQRDFFDVDVEDEHEVSAQTATPLPDELLNNLKYFLARQLPGKSPLTVGSMFSAIVHFLSQCDWEDVGEESLTDVLSEQLIDYIYVNRSQSNEYALNALRYWYRRSYRMGLSTFEYQTAQALGVFKFRGNLKGADVISYFPHRSPLTAQELDALQQVLREAQIDVSHDSYRGLLSAWLLISLGLRSKQLVLLMNSDFLINVDQHSGEKTYVLNVPSVKKRHELPRSRFKSRQLPTFLGEMLEKYMHHKESEMAQLSAMFADIGGDIPPFAKQPIFAISRWKIKKRYEERLVHLPYLQNLPSDSVQKMLQKMFGVINTARVREGKMPLDLKITPRRLRKTFATRAAATGVPIIELAELLDHEDLQHVMVYYQLGLSFAQKLDRVFQEQFKDILSYFKGQINLTTLISQTVPNTVFGPDKLRRLVGIGMCAKGAPCDLTPPNACYVCPKFEACNDPTRHREVLDSMKADVKVCFGEDAPPELLNAPHIKACEELVNTLEACHE